MISCLLASMAAQASLFVLGVPEAGMIFDGLALCAVGGLFSGLGQEPPSPLDVG